MIEIGEPEGLDWVGEVIRPPSEAASILIQATLGCSHHKCTFCGTYRDQRFALKDPAILARDLAFAERHCRRQNRLFVMDGDALVMPMPRWEWLLGEVGRRLPWVERVATYANRKAVAQRSDAELRRLRELRLGLVYYGVESGHPLVLARIRKGADPARLVAQGRRIKAAGIKLSVTVLLGIGGMELSREHARATGELLSALDPDYVGALTLMLLPETPLGRAAARGDFVLPPPRDLLAELRAMLAATDLSGGLFAANHASNYLPLRVRLPQERDAALALLDRALAGGVGLRPEWLRGL